MNIDLFQKTLHFNHPQQKDGRPAVHHMVLVSMTDGGKIGLGECAPLPGVSCDEEAYTRMSDVARLINEALASDDHAEYLRPYPALLFALESALYDMTKSELLYSTPFALAEEGIPCCGRVEGGPFDAMLAQAKRKILCGCRSLQLSLAAASWDEALELIRILRSKYRKETLEIRVDAEGTFTPRQAQERMELLARHGVHSLTQPIASGDWKALAGICREAPLPIALDAELIGMNRRHEKEALLDTIRPQFLVLRPMLHGGISGTMEWVSLARKRGIGSWLASTQESNVGRRNVALLAARCYGPHVLFTQGLDCEQLFSDDIPMDLQSRGSKVWREEVNG